MMNCIIAERSEIKRKFRYNTNTSTSCLMYVYLWIYQCKEMPDCYRILAVFKVVAVLLRCSVYNAHIMLELVSNG